MNRTFADISNNNPQTIGWHAYRSEGHVLVGLKASEGTNFVDKYHATRSQEAHKAGVWVIHYHFAHPNRSAGAQAQFFWNQIRTHFAARDFACVDIEVSDGFTYPAINQWVRAFTAEFRRVSGHTLIGYSGESFLGSLGSCGINRWWVAKYGSGFPVAPANASVWAFQFTDGSAGPEPHSAAGIGHCDMSRLNWGTYLRLRASRPKG